MADLRARVGVCPDCNTAPTYDATGRVQPLPDVTWVYLGPTPTELLGTCVPHVTGCPSLPDTGMIPYRTVNAADLMKETPSGR